MVRNKIKYNLPKIKEISNDNTTNIQLGGNTPIRTITLKKVMSREN